MGIKKDVYLTPKLMIEQYIQSINKGACDYFIIKHKRYDVNKIAFALFIVAMDSSLSIHYVTCTRIDKRLIFENDVFKLDLDNGSISDKIIVEL